MHDREEKFVRRLAGKKEGTRQHVEPKKTWKDILN
jgi:hypothetical protein